MTVVSAGREEVVEGRAGSADGAGERWQVCWTKDHEDEIIAQTYDEDDKYRC
jgi:hypothetical protein